MKYKYYPNSRDGNHCVQACLQTLLDRFDLAVPNLEELDKVTHHHPGSYTWMTSALIWLASQGFKIIHVENVDYRQFAERGPAYLSTIYSKDVFELQDRMSDLKMEQEFASKLITTSGINLIHNRLAISDIGLFLEKGYSALVSVNPFVLDGRSDLVGSHLVVVTSISPPTEASAGIVTICDPDVGWRVIRYEVFEKAVQKDDFSMTFCIINKEIHIEK